MRKDEKCIVEAYVTQVPTAPVATATLPSFNKPSISNTQEQEEAKKQPAAIKDWIRLPFIDTPFKARMAAVLIVELIHNLTRDPNLRDLVLKEIRTNNRLSKRR